MTLEQAFPGLRDVPGGAIVAAAGNLFDVGGPAFEAQMALAENWTREIIGQIKAADPTWGYHRLAPPTTISEMYDQLGSMILGAPTFKDKTGVFEDRDIDSEFKLLFDGFDRFRSKFGEERYAQMVDLATRAKAFFAADQDNTNGKTDEGYALLFEMEDVLTSVRRRRVRDKLPDDEGEITGD